MKTFRFAAILAAAILSLSFCSMAQEIEKEQDDFISDNGTVVRAGSISIVKTTPELGGMLSRARPQEPNTSQAPAFAIKTDNNKFVLSIGGCINPIMGWDIGNNLYNTDDAGIQFVTGQIPVPAVTGHKGDFFISALDSYLDATFVAFGGSANELTGYMKLGTNDVNSQLKLKRAFITYRGFLAGYANTLINDGDASQPPTIDPQGPGGILGTTAYQVAYKSKDYNGFRFAIGLEMPSFCNSNGYYLGKDFKQYYGKKIDASVDHLVPDVPMWIQYGRGNNRVRFSALLRNFAYQDMLAQKRRSLWGYGVMLSGNFSFYKPLVFNYQAVYGRGIANYIQDLAGRELSITPKNDKPGYMETNPMMGLVFGASYNATNRLQFNVVGSYTRVWNVGPYAVTDDTDITDANGNTVRAAGNNNFRYSTYVAANCFYKFSSFVKVGMEYLYGHRETWNMGGANDSRIQTQLSLTF